MLLEQVRTICERLAPHGWTELFAAHGLDIGAADLAAELARPLPHIDRTRPGFEDFALEGVRGIEPRHPARSLLFHALASPSVVEGLTAFPTPAELDVVENYVYGVTAPSLPELLARTAPASIAVVVFATEYRPGSHTPHRRHADVCFSRTGIARVGTAPARYDGRRRGFVPTVDDDVHAFRVLPARYSAYLAVLVPGSEEAAVPMRFSDGDGERRFWVPVHKLFPGAECLRGKNLHVEVRAHHVNEKLRRIHLALGPGASWAEPDISEPPFRFTDGIAELATDPDLPQGTVVPVVHPRLVEPAEYKGQPLTFLVPKGETLSSSFSIAAEGGRRRGPEYVHVRHEITPDGQEIDLNERPDVVDVVAAGGYRARHYLDFTGEGWVEAVVPELATDVPRPRPAYSLIAAPDYFPAADQRELTEWTSRRVPSALRGVMWQISPDPLSDERFPANLQLPGAGFRPDDDTITAIVAPSVVGVRAQTPLDAEAALDRHTYLPDDAAGVFAPGWDVSLDGVGDGPDHLAAYGLGSPFPEDSKLCAALSSFWPAVAPDAARTFEPAEGWPTVSPLTDEEIGSVGDLPWDGVPGPRLVEVGGEQVVEYRSFAHADYVQNALDGSFTLALTSRIDEPELQARMLAMVRAYAALGVDLSLPFDEVVQQKAQWTVVSFRSADPAGQDIHSALEGTGVTLQEPLYQLVCATHGPAAPAPGVVGRIHVPVRRLVRLLVDPVTVLTQEGEGAWTVR